MRTQKNKFILFIVCAALLSGACGGFKSSTDDRVQASVPLAAPLASDASAADNTLRFLENRIKSDPEDFSAHNKLAGLYLQKLRETGDVAFLDLAFRSARASLDSVPDAANSGGLAALVQAEFAAHEFAAARDHAVRLTELEPGKSYPQGMLGDALVELGEYDKAEIAYKKITLLDGGSSYVSETRFARLAQLHGDNQAAQKHFSTALALALNQTAPPREAVAWCRWQLGETAFSVGDYETAEKNYTDALITFPDYYRAIASRGSLLAARGDLPGAISQYEKVVLILPDPTYIAVLGDLYKLAGREEEAGRQYELVEKIGHLSELNGALYNRQLALFYADHDIKTEDAYRLAAKEYETRRDIYGADALAWTALKAGKLTEAQAAMKDASRLGTKDARLFYHAGMIEKAAGNNARAADYLQKALKLNPAFDPLQAAKARAALEELKHAVESDHLAAVSTIVSERKSLWSSTIIGGVWGLGHTISLVAAAICVLILDFQISVQTERRLELCVGAMLFLLGLNVLRKLLQGGNLSFRRHGHGNLDHAHPYVHAFGNEETEPHTHHDLSFSPRALII